MEGTASTSTKRDDLLDALAGSIELVRASRQSQSPQPFTVSPAVEPSATLHALPSAPVTNGPVTGPTVHTDPRPIIETLVHAGQVKHQMDLSQIAPDIIRDIARALAQDNRLVQLIVVGRANQYPGAQDRVERDRALRSIVDTLVDRGALLIDLHPDHIEGLQADLVEAVAEQPLCVRGDCEAFAESGDDYCMAHGRGTW